MKVALDTNIVFAYFDRDEGVVEKVLSAGQVCFPLPVLAELLFAAEKSARRKANFQHIRDLKSAANVLIPTEETAGVYADIRLALEKKGRPIPVNDIWIAAICREHGVPLATRDAHFDEVG